MNKLFLRIIPIFTILQVSIALSAGPQDLTIINKTGYEIHQIHIASKQETTWGKSLMLDKIIPNGGSFMVRLHAKHDKGCIFDIKIIDQDGDTYVKMNINLCSVNKLVFTEKDLK
jgi:hypothetical protein